MPVSLHCAFGNPGFRSKRGAGDSTPGRSQALSRIVQLANTGRLALLGGAAPGQSLATTEIQIGTVAAIATTIDPAAGAGTPTGVALAHPAVDPAGHAHALAVADGAAQAECDLRGHRLDLSRAERPCGVDPSAEGIEQPRAAGRRLLRRPGASASMRYLSPGGPLPGRQGTAEFTQVMQPRVRHDGIAEPGAGSTVALPKARQGGFS